MPPKREIRPQIKRSHPTEPPPLPSILLAANARDRRVQAVYHRTDGPLQQQHSRSAIRSAKSGEYVRTKRIFCRSLAVEHCQTFNLRPEPRECPQCLRAVLRPPLLLHSSMLDYIFRSRTVWKNHEAEINDDGRDQSAEEQFERRNTTFEVFRKDALPGRIRSVRNHRQTATGHRTGNNRVLCAEGNPVHLGGQVGDRRIVVECGQDGRAEHERLVRKRLDDRSDPPSLHAAVDHESREEESDKHRAFHIHRVLVVAGGHYEGEEKQEAADEQDRVVCRINSPRQETEVRAGDPGGNRRFALLPGLRVELAVLDSVRHVGNAEQCLAERKGSTASSK